MSEQLDALHAERNFSEIVSGDEGGAERVALQWATVRNIPTIVFSRQKAKTKSKSLPLLGLKPPFEKGETVASRNARMLSSAKPGLVIAFGAGESTNLLVEEARRNGIEVIQIDVPAF